jgi:hypothetical protein
MLSRSNGYLARDYEGQESCVSSTNVFSAGHPKLICDLRLVTVRCQCSDLSLHMVTINERAQQKADGWDLITNYLFRLVPTHITVSLSPRMLLEDVTVGARNSAVAIFLSGGAEKRIRSSVDCLNYQIHTDVLFLSGVFYAGTQPCDSP